ncbi:MAG: DUF885 domain-containing protein [Candidatus Zixiibacteriota bacterium]
MPRDIFPRFFLIAAAVLLLTRSALAADSPGLTRLGNEILESIQSFYPVNATAIGIHAYDHRFTDYSSGSVDQFVKKLTDFEKQLYKFKGANLSVHDQVNYKLLKSNVDIALMDLKRIQWYKKSPQLYADEAVFGIYYLILSNHAPLSERAVSIVNRMKALPDYLAKAKKNIKKPPKVYIDAAIETLEAGQQFYKDVAAELSNKFPERADELARVSNHAREAMNDFVTFLGNVTPGPENSFAIGKENFDYMLSNLYYLDYDSDSLLRLGESLFVQANQAYREYEEYVESHHQNGSDSVFVPANFTKQDILDYYGWEIQQEKIYVETHGLVTVPENVAPIMVVEVPSFMRALVTGIAYEPAPPFDSVQQGLFYIRPIPDDLDRRQLEARYRYVHRRGFKGYAVHEAYPGHHLQMQIASMNSDPVRKWQRNYLMIEGWGLYSEELMYSAGLYGDEDPAMWLEVLDGIRFRAARIVADVKLHTGQFTYDQCVRWMIDALGVTTDYGKEYMKTEVRRYTTTPTNQMSYLIGKLEIMKLLRAAEARDGENFNIRDFHDALLTEGSIPPTLMWEILGLSRN